MKKTKKKAILLITAMILGVNLQTTVFAGIDQDGGSCPWYCGKCCF